MPNTGKPSTGCFACRKMKVRCDEEKPFCMRCRRANRICPGYRSPFVLVDPLKISRRNRTRLPLDNAPELTVQSKHPGSVPLPSSPRSSEQDWYLRALKLFYHTHTSAPCVDHRPSLRFFDTLETYCSKSTLKPYLVDALKAASLSNIAYRVPGLAWLSLAAIQHRVKALAGIRAALANKTDALEDDLLIALWCIEKAELMDVDQHVLQNHAAGISTVIKFRGEQQLSTDTGRRLFHEMNIDLALRDTVLGTEFHSKIDVEQPVPTVLLIQVAGLVKAYRQMLEGRAIHGKEFLFTQAKLLDSRIQMMRQWLPARQHEEIRSVNDSTITISYHKSTTDARLWLAFYTMRVRVLRVAAECSNVPRELADTISAQVYGIAGLVPSLLSEGLSAQDDPSLARGSSVGALAAMYACNTVANAPEIEDKHIQSWALDRLSYIAQAFGIKQALSFLDYYRSGTALTDAERLRAVSSGKFPPSTPSFIVGHGYNRN